MATTKLISGVDLGIIHSVIKSIDYSGNSCYRSLQEALEIEQATGRDRSEGRRILREVFDYFNDPPVYERLVRHNNWEARYDADDFVNPDEFRDHRRKYGKAYVVLNGGTVLAIVFGCDCDQDALDAACDADKLDGLLVTEEELKDYETGNFSNHPDAPNGIGWPEYEGIINLGNASEPFASESLDIWEVSSEQFAEDPALMTLDRVMEYLKEREDELERTYKATPLDEPAEPGKPMDREWMDAYRAHDNALDAITLARFSQCR